MLMDFYYSKKMRKVGDWLNGLESEKVCRHMVYIDGHDYAFTCQVEHGKDHGVQWDDVEFIGTASKDNITYEFQ